jgi:hypothetical protein
MGVEIAIGAFGLAERPMHINAETGLIVRRYFSYFVVTF